MMAKGVTVTVTVTVAVAALALTNSGSETVHVCMFTILISKDWLCIVPLVCAFGVCRWCVDPSRSVQCSESLFSVVDLKKKWTDGSR